MNALTREHEGHRKGRKFLFIGSGAYLVLLFILGGFALGVQVGKHQEKEEARRIGQVLNRNAPPSYISKDVDFNQFWEVWERVRDNFAHQPVSETQLFYGAMKGIVFALGDPYSAYLDPDQAAEFARELGGLFEGIGAEIGFRDSRLIIVSPLPDTPAKRAGLEPGDSILEIDGLDTTGMPLEVAVSKIRGPKGTSVTLTIFREGFTEPKEFVIARDQIIVRSVKWNMVDQKGKEVKSGGTYGLITINQFNEDTVKDFDAAAREILLRDPKGIILDLRNNPGGYLDAAVEVAGGWVDRMVVVTERFTDDKKTEFRPSRKATLRGIPTVVLVNKGSASASEIVAGALQDYGLATVVGETTFGKGSVQNYEDFPDGSAIKLTIAEWFTPKERSIDKHGIAPDIEVKRSEEDFKADFDPQFEKALEVLAR